MPLDNFIEELPDGISFDMIYVEGGVFMMGSEEGVKDEKPIHKVALNSFYIGKYSVTQKLWETIMGDWEHSVFLGDERPVERVSWYDVQIFLKKLKQLSGKTYRLPTEAEWEFAAKGGNQSKGFIYAGSDKLEEVGWYIKNSDRETKHLRQLYPNELGLYDMSGNVFEWCQDWFGVDYYDECAKQGIVHNPVGPKSGALRVRRGGSWYSSSDNCRSSYRNGDRRGDRDNNLGFRLVISPSSQEGWIATSEQMPVQSAKTKLVI